jgi:hypothetical protein
MQTMKFSVQGAVLRAIGSLEPEYLADFESACNYLASTADEDDLLLDFTRKALADSDARLGHEIIVEERNITGRCDAFIERLAANDLPSRLGIPWALLARHLKRVGAHLGNLASSLVMPVHKLDYFDEKSLPGQQVEGA